MPVDEGWYTSVEASEILCCHRTTVLNMVTAGHIKAFEISARGDKRITRENLISFMKEREIPLEILERYETERSTKRVLVVEDHKPFAQRVAGAIAGNDRRIEVKIARTTTEGAILLGEFRPHLLLVDWKLGAATAEEFLAGIGRKRQALGARVIMMSARPKSEIAPGEEIEDKMRRLGVDEFVYKFEKVSTIRDAALSSLGLRERREVFRMDRKQADYNK